MTDQEIEALQAEARKRDLESQSEIQRLKDIVEHIDLICSEVGDNYDTRSALAEIEELTKGVAFGNKPAPVVDEIPRLPRLDISNCKDECSICPLTGKTFDEELHSCGKYHSIVYARWDDAEDIGEFDTAELAWDGIEDWRNAELRRALKPMEGGGE